MTKPKGRASVGCVLVLGSMLWAGCKAVTPIGPGFVYQPDARECRLWESSREQSAALQASGSIYRDRELTDYLQSVLVRVLGENLSPYVPLEPKVYVIDSPVVNAFAWPHGHIFVNTGLLGRMRNEAQLAMILGHEITHSTHRHSDQERDDATDRTNVLAYVTVLSAAGGADLSNAVAKIGGLLTTAAVNGYSRDKEREADSVGLTLAAQARYDPREASRAFQRLFDATDPKGRRWNALYASHPKMKERVRSCKQLVQRLHPDLIAQSNNIGQDRYLAHVTPLIYKEVERHIAQGKFQLADETLEFMATAQPEDATPRALHGDLYRAWARDGDSDRGIASYEQALELDASCSNAHRGLGLLLAKNGNPGRSMQHFKAYLRLAPDAADSAYIEQYLRKLEDKRSHDER